MDNATGDTLAVVGDDGNKGSCEVINVGDAIITMAGRVSAGIGWLIATPQEETSFLESFIRHFCFLATSKVG